MIINITFDTEKDSQQKLMDIFMMISNAVKTERATNPDLIRIEDLELTVRTTNVLRNKFECVTMADILKFKKSDLLKANNFGRKSLNELIECLASKGFLLKDYA